MRRLCLRGRNVCAHSVATRIIRERSLSSYILPDVTRIIGAWILTASLISTALAAQTLDIYFIDVEGGQSTLIVTPGGESLLIDTGYAGNSGRDPRRILTAAQDAGLQRIDYLLITHFHGDHDGGAPELSRLIPIGTFVDHDGLTDTTDAGVVEPFNAYAAVRAKGRHIVARPGDRIPLKGVDVRVVSSGAATIVEPLRGVGERNLLCEPGPRPPGETIENPRSTGIHLRFGQFRFVDLGDLSGQPLYSLFCPVNLLGPVDVYLVPHHGGADTASLDAFAMRPRVAIMNNGATKGGSSEGFATLHQAVAAQGLEDVWQVDKSSNAGAKNFPDERIANLDGTTSHWIKIRASEDGTFTVTNARTGRTKTYQQK
jgi:competence protein ComEC